MSGCTETMHNRLVHVMQTCPSAFRTRGVHPCDACVHFVTRLLAHADRAFRPETGEEVMWRQDCVLIGSQVSLLALH